MNHRTSHQKHNYNKTTNKKPLNRKVKSNPTNLRQSNKSNKSNNHKHKAKTHNIQRKVSQSGGAGLYDVNNFDFTTKINPPPKPPFGCSIL